MNNNKEKYELTPIMEPSKAKLPSRFDQTCTPQKSVSLTGKELRKIFVEVLDIISSHIY